MKNYSPKKGSKSEAPVRQDITKGTSDRGKQVDVSVPPGRAYTYAPSVKKGS